MATALRDKIKSLSPERSSASNLKYWVHLSSVGNAHTTELNSFNPTN